MLHVEIMVYGAKDLTLLQKLERSCGCGDCDWSTIRSRIVHAPEALVGLFFSVIGEPADDRTKGDMGMLIAIPFIIFLFVVWFGWLLLHYNAIAAVMIAGLIFFVALGMVVLGVTSHKNSKIPFFALGCLMIIAVACGILICDHGWSKCWRQWWWMHTGQKLGGSAGTPAAALSDSSVITFEGVKDGTQWTSADASRSAGYRKGDIYCAAPILDPTVALGNIMRVEFWAIGINCCDDYGSFTCDASRETTGSVGVVMKGGGMPCYDCHAEEFRMAALKAEGVNRMVSAPGALFVRYVTDASTVENSYLAQVVFSFFWSLIIGLLFFGLLGFLTNYKGWGKQGHFPLYNLLGHKKVIHHIPETPMEEAKQKIVDDEEKKWTLVLTPNSNAPGDFNIAALKPEEETAMNSTNYGGVA